VTLERESLDALWEAGGLFQIKTSPEGWRTRKLRVDIYTPEDIRALPPYLSASSCDEINAACDRFLASRGKLTGKAYAKFLNNNHHE
jgi:hypothetical protein